MASYFELQHHNDLVIEKLSKVVRKPLLRARYHYCKPVILFLTSHLRNLRIAQDSIFFLQLYL